MTTPLQYHTRLVNRIEENNRLYYELNTPQVSDAQYDEDLKELRELERKCPELVSKSSPTQKVASSLTKNSIKVKHLTPMLSLYTETDFSQEGAQAFVKRIKNQITGDENYPTPTGLNYCCELKFDGLAINLLYKEGTLVQASTRGDGEYGEDVTANAKMMPSIIQQLGGRLEGIHSYKIGKPNRQDLFPSTLEIRGEVLMPKSQFERINKELVRQGKKPYVNERAAAAGSMRLNDPKTMSERGLIFYAYALGEDLDWFEGYTQSKILKTLKDMGVSVHPSYKVVNSVQGLIDYHETVRSLRSTLDFHIDGVVYKVESLATQDKLGYSGREPRWATAHKFEPEEALTTIQAIDIQVGRTGKLTPVARLTPVFVGGVTITNVTLHNEDHIKRLGVQVGDGVLVRRAGDVIPEIFDIMDRGGVAVVKGSCTSGYVFPTHCPECGGLVIREEGKADHYCSNKLGCPAQLKQAIIHLTSRKALNVIGMGESMVDLLVDSGVVKTLVDIYCIGLRDELEGTKFSFEETIDDIKNVDSHHVQKRSWRLCHFTLTQKLKLGDMISTNLCNSLNDSKSTTLPKFLYSLGIPNAGEGTAKRLVNHYGTLEAIMSASEEDLSTIKDIGPVVAKSLYSFFKDVNNQMTIKTFQELGVHWNNKPVVAQSTSQSLSGKTFVITGTSPGVSREKLTQLIEANGGSVSGNVTAKTSYVIAGDNAGSKLAKAKELNASIISMTDVFNHFNLQSEPLNF